MQNIISLMKAAQYSQYGDPKVIQINETERPSLKENTILVEVFAASINPFDYKVRRGYLKNAMPLNFPVTICGDYSGKVVELGSGVTEFKIGDEVYGQASFFGVGSGSAAEFARAPVEKSALKPKNIDFLEAASLPLTGISAIQALVDHIRLQKNQKILIHGGTCGRGSIAIQIAKHLGAYVITTVSTENIEMAKALGANEVIDYKKDKFEENPPAGGLDAVFDTVGGETSNKSFEVLKKGGIFVSMSSSFDKNLAVKNEVIAIAQNSEVTTERLEKLDSYVDRGIVKPQVDKIFNLVDTAKAFEYQENNHPRGKVVIKIK